MISKIRQAYNASFTEEKYKQFLASIAAEFSFTPTFRIAETPVFISDQFTKKLKEASNEIIGHICDPNFKTQTAGALNEKNTVLGEDDHTLFLQLDFGVCIDEDGTPKPELIEVQGFPTLYFYQALLAEKYREFFDIPSDVNHLFGGWDNEQYRAYMTDILLNGHKPENTVLLEIEPENQTTKIDFYCTKRHTGMPYLCVSDIKKSGRELYYTNESGQNIPIYRIYNRVIFDELDQRPDLKMNFSFLEDLDVEWAGHPNWFFRLSKYCLPFLNSRYTPYTQFLDRVDRLPENLEDFVIKPLYSFAGSGIIFDVTKADIDRIEHPENYILQEKVAYQPIVKALDGDVKAEIRMLFIWPRGEKRPILINNLTRLSRGKMIGVKYNKDKSWVGGSLSFFPEGS